MANNNVNLFWLYSFEPGFQLMIFWLWVVCSTAVLRDLKSMMRVPILVSINFLIKWINPQQQVSCYSFRYFRRNLGEQQNSTKLDKNLKFKSKFPILETSRAKKLFNLSTIFLPFWVKQETNPLLQFQIIKTFFWVLRPRKRMAHEHNLGLSYDYFV